MHVKDLIVTGDARILGKLYTDTELGGGGGGGETSGTYTLSKSGSTISLLRDGQSVSSVQDSDTISSYTHPVYGALTGKPTAKLTPSHGGTFEVSQVKTDNLGHVTALTTQQITLPGGYSHPGTHPATMITGLAKVATSGSYNDLSNKPSIPAAANNGTLTIQRNGTNVATFSANQSSNATANISVPTKVSQLTNDSGYTTEGGHTHNYAGSSSAGGSATSAVNIDGGAYIVASASAPTNANAMIWIKTTS